MSFKSEKCVKIVNELGQPGQLGQPVQRRGSVATHSVMSMGQGGGGPPGRDSFSPVSVNRASSVQLSQHDAMMQQQMFQQQQQQMQQMQRVAMEQQMLHEQQMIQEQQLLQECVFIVVITIDKHFFVVTK